MKRLALLSFLLFLGCQSDSDDGGSANAVSPGTYRAPLTMKWFEDDAAPRNFIDEQILGSGREGEGRLYLIRSGDTALMCEGMFSWEQKGAVIRTWDTRQRCKDPDYLVGGFDAWDYYEDTTDTPIRNVTSAGFEMKGATVDGATFWAKYSLQP